MLVLYKADPSESQLQGVTNSICRCTSPSLLVLKSEIKRTRAKKCILYFLTSCFSCFLI